MSKQIQNEDILTLSPLEHVRLRPGVYAGDTSNSNQLVIEVFANALDCYNAGYGDRIIIDILDDGTISCEDYGQGFVVNELREDNTTTLEAAFSVMNTSGKFSDEGFYGGTSLGLNGMGSKICTYLSHWLWVQSGRGGRLETIMFEEGVFKERDVIDCAPDYSGTCVKFKPSEEFFKDPHPDNKYLETFFNDIACLCPGLTIIFNKKQIKHDGIDDLLTNKVGNAIEIINNRLSFNEKQGNQSLNFGLTFTGNSSATIIPYVNCGATDTGPHITAIKSTITRVLNNWAKEQKIFGEKEKNLDGASIQEGMVMVCNITSSSAAYNAQVKTTITQIDTSFISFVLGKQLEIWLDNNPNDGKIIIEKALIARRAAEAAKKARAAVKAKVETKDKVFKLPTTLTDCWTKKRNEAELLVCEGKSAASGLVAARNSETQAVYGVRGKMLSVLKTTPEKIMANVEINNLIQALGLECNPKTAKLKYDKNKLRYNKIIACADADPDGQAIENLLFNILWYLCPDLIIEGHVYSAVPPLFRITTSKNEYIYLTGQRELEEYKEQHKNEKFQINRNKGLGEQDAEELATCLLEPETRNILQLTINDIGKVDMLFDDLYGKRVEPRVKFLLEHSEEANID